MNGKLAGIVVLLIMGVLMSGCTSQPVQTPPTTASGDTPVQKITATTASAPSLTGTNWNLGWYDDTKGVWSKVIEGSKITAVFGNNGKVSGFGGCTQYSTDYQLPNAPGIWIKRPVVQPATCHTPTGVMGQESFYYTDLEWATTYKIENGQLLMFDKTGKRILQFDPVP